MMTSSKICIDTGPIVQLLIYPDSQAAKKTRELIADPAVQLIAPALLFFELTNALHRQHKVNFLSSSLVEDALFFAMSMPIALVDDLELHLAALQAAERFNLNAAYDAHYLALAEREGVELWTTDKKLHRAVQAAGVDWVRLIE